MVYKPLGLIKLFLALIKRPSGAMKYILRAIKWSTGCLGLIKTFIGLDKTAIGGDKMVYGQHSGAIKWSTSDEIVYGKRPLA